MVILIVTINLFITLLNIYIAIKIWQLRQIIAKITTIVLNCDLYFYALLHNTPQLIYQGKDKIQNLKIQYQTLQLQLQQIRQILLLLNWSYRLWRGYLKQ